MVEVTPMIGVNDVHPEVFTMDDATLVANFAKQKGIGMLSMWSMTRDHACPGGSIGSLSPSCSGVAQIDYQFAKTFMK
jgi:hypothetical protein